MNILLVRLRLIGDVVFTTPIIAALRRAYPAARLTYLVEPSAAPVVAHNPHLSRIITVPHSRGWKRVVDDVRVGLDLRRSRFDLVVDLHGGPRSAWFTWASRARVRVGYDVPGRSWMYTRVVTRPRGYRPRHAVENQWDLMAAIDPALARPATRDGNRVEMPVTSEAVDAALQALAALGIPADASLVVMHVSAGNPFRRWPEAAFAAVAARLTQADDRRWTLVTAGPSDREAAQRIVTDARRTAGASGARIVVADTLSLPALRATLDRAAVFIGGDSGPLHIAATADVPIVGLYGPTLPERSAPWRPASIPTASVEPGPLACRPCDQRTCVPGDFRCLAQVSPEAVYVQAARLLELAR